MKRGHGGNIYQLARKIGCAPSEILDFSSNVNPLGPPPGLHAFLTERLAGITALPEVDAAGIRRAFSRRYAVDPDRVLAGNGTTQLIYSLPQALESRKALVLVPAYADYADACALHDIPCSYLIAAAEEAFCYSRHRILEAIEEAGADVVFICNPNNPTGVLLPPSDLIDICAAAPRVNFVIDESYLSFAPAGESRSLMHQTAAENIIVLHSMSKIFRVPGLRIGFAVSAPALIDKMERYIPPWSINSLSQIAVDWLMRQETVVKNFIAETVTTLEAEKNFLQEQFFANSKLTLFPSTTSFILAVLAEPFAAEAVCRYLGEQRLLIRNCENFAGLSPRYIRFSLKTRSENRRLAEALQGYLREGAGS